MIEIWFLDTPEQRRSTDFCYGNSAFLGQKSQVQAFIDQINEMFKCHTSGCEGLLRPVSVRMVGLGGCVKMNYDCNGCVECRLMFASSALHEASKQTVVSVALQVGFVAAGCSHALSWKVLAYALGMYGVSFGHFYKVLKMMQPVVEQSLNEQCERTKQEMKYKPDSAFGRFKKLLHLMAMITIVKNFIYHMWNYWMGQAL